MNLCELVFRKMNGSANEEGSKIPWDDPDFSRRMLTNHLSQEHNWASRRKDIIAAHTAWIAGLLDKKTPRVLDLGCGPGFYTEALAALGHRCTGVDFSPASIEYAGKQAVAAGLGIEYILQDIRSFRSEKTFDCILMTFGEFNVFTRKDAEGILHNCAGMLAENGLLVLETHTYEAVRAIGLTQPLWTAQESGLFSNAPHLCLQENIWDEARATALSRYFIVDAESAKVQLYSSFMQAYTDEEYDSMLAVAGLCAERLQEAEYWPSGEEFEGRLQVLVCRKGASESAVGGSGRASKKMR